MKNVASLLILVMCLLSACTKVGKQEGEYDDSSIQLGTGVEQDIVLDADGGSEIIRFTAPQNWHVELSEEASWLELSPVEGVAGTGRVKVKADANTSGGTRRTEFSVCSGSQSVKFHVTRITMR